MTAKVQTTRVATALRAPSTHCRDTPRHRSSSTRISRSGSRREADRWAASAPGCPVALPPSRPW
jgi:hypothetical protein